MITNFSVSNFKSFNTEFVLDLQDTNAYEFNKISIKNGVVNNALIYGHNGVGKSNLGLAIFDILGHLTDKEIADVKYTPYLNAYSKFPNTASFHYEMVFDGNVVSYDYSKTSVRTVVAESISINGVEFAKIDKRINNEAEIKFKGAESLKRELTNPNLSLLRYIKNNTQLDQNLENEILFTFFKFVEGMLFFKSLDHNMYQGIETGSYPILDDIIEKKNVKDLEQFLNFAGIECELEVIKEVDKDIIAFSFNGNKIPFYKVASTGTRSLTLFYFWLQRLREQSKVSFLFIDEFDAFYHHELSSMIVEELKKTGVQFMLTTHNTSILTNDLLRPDCYFLMNKEAIKSLAKCTQKELREAHNIEKMYKAGSFNV